MSAWLIDPTQRILASALDGLALREQAVAANLSNIDWTGSTTQTTEVRRAHINHEVRS